MHTSPSTTNTTTILVHLVCTHLETLQLNEPMHVFTLAVYSTKQISNVVGGHPERPQGAGLGETSTGPAWCPAAVTPYWDRVELLPYASSLYKTQSSDTRVAEFQQMPKPQKSSHQSRQTVLGFSKA